jgi:hypothetical protein
MSIAIVTVIAIASGVAGFLTQSLNSSVPGIPRETYCL